MTTSQSSVEKRKRKLSTDELYEDGEILSDDEIPLKVIKIENDNQSESLNLNDADKRIENNANSVIIDVDNNTTIERIDKNETIHGFMVIEDTDKGSSNNSCNDNILLEVDDKETLKENEKNYYSQSTETTDSGIGSQSLEICENLTPNDEESSLIESPCISIQFKDDSISEQYKLKFLRFFNNFIELKPKFTDKLTLEIYQDKNIDPNEWVVVDETFHESLIDEDVKNDTLKKHKKKTSKTKKDLFVLDANPSDTPHRNCNNLRYTSKFVINSSDKKLGEHLTNLKCFNCNGDHALKDCKQPKDHRRINTAREKSKQQRSTRYHLESQQKFNHLHPGKLSNELRNALGLHRNELPPFIYKMRRIGYPPGWLEEAKVVNSDLDLFDIDGKNLKNLGRKSTNCLDPAKIIDYPGFNVPLDKHHRDEYKFYGVPPYSEAFNKETMIQYVNDVLKKLNDNLETVDMDLDDEDATMITISDDDNNDKCKTLSELEQQKQQLLNELKNDDEKSTTITDKSANESDKDRNTIVKSTSYGTPIIKTNSQFNKLPHPDKFSKDVSPIINFENLPNSTGKYEQMIDVLQKVRTTLKNQQNSPT